MPRYVPEDSLKSPRFTGPSTFARLPLVRDLADVDVAIVGVPFDTGVTYRVGGRFGPNAVRAASVMLRPYNTEPRGQPVRGAVVRRLRRRRHRARATSSAATTAIEQRGRPDRRGGRRPAAHRRRPCLHAAAPARDAIARPGRGHRLRCAHRRLGQLLRGEVQPWDVDASRDRGGARRRRPLDRGGPARARSTRPSDWTRPAHGARVSTTSRPRRCSTLGPEAVADRILERVGDRPAFLTLRHRRRGPGPRPGHRHAGGGRAVGPRHACHRPPPDRPRLRRVRRRRGHPGLRPGRPDRDARRQPGVRDAVARGAPATRPAAERPPSGTLRPMTTDGSRPTPRRASAGRARPGRSALGDPSLLRHPRDDGRRHQPGRGRARLRHAAGDRGGRRRGLREGRTHYTSNYGTLELRRALAEHLERRYGVAYDPATELLITVGASEAVDLALRATCDPGDEVILHEPSYVAYVPAVVFAGGTVRHVPTRFEDDFALDPAAVEAAVTSRTKALFLGLPVQPDRRRAAPGCPGRAGRDRRPPRSARLQRRDLRSPRLRRLSPPRVQCPARDARADDPHGWLLEGLRDDRLARRVHGGAGGDPRRAS